MPHPDISPVWSPRGSRAYETNQRSLKSQENSPRSRKEENPPKEPRFHPYARGARSQPLDRSETTREAELKRVEGSVEIRDATQDVRRPKVDRVQAWTWDGLYGVHHADICTVCKKYCSHVWEANMKKQSIFHDEGELGKASGIS